MHTADRPIAITSPVNIKALRSEATEDSTNPQFRDKIDTMHVEHQSCREIAVFARSEATKQSRKHVIMLTLDCFAVFTNPCINSQRTKSKPIAGRRLALCVINYRYIHTQRQVASVKHPRSGIH